MSDREESPELEHRNGDGSPAAERHDAEERSDDDDSPKRSRSRSPKRRRRYSRSRSRSPRDDHRRKSRRSRSRSDSPPPRRRSPYGRRTDPRHYGSRDDPEPSRCLGVFGMSLYTTERDLKDYFGQYGAIECVQIVYDHPTGRSRGFGFIYFENTEDAIEAKERATGSEIDGHKVRIDYSVTKRAHTPTPGVYMGSRSGRRSPPSGHRNRSGGFRDRGFRRSTSPRNRRRSRSFDRNDYY